VYKVTCADVSLFVFICIPVGKSRHQEKEEFEDTKGGNKNPSIEEGQTKHWLKEKVQEDIQQSTKYYT